MNETAIIEYITGTFEGVYTLTASGDTFFMYDPTGMFPFATLVTSDVNDTFSNLERPGVFRLNIGLSKSKYSELFGAPPTRDDAEISGDYDFTALDKLLPHPVYGRQYWACILNPGFTAFETVVKPLLAEAYNKDVVKHSKRPKAE
jgi:Family of unknown function (DUF6194)